MIPIVDKEESRELFEWVKASEELPELEKFLNLKIDGHPDYGQFYELQSGIKCAALRWRLPSCDFHRIEWLKPIPSSLKEEKPDINKINANSTAQEMADVVTSTLINSIQVQLDEQSSLTPKSIRDSSENETKK